MQEQLESTGTKLHKWSNDEAGAQNPSSSGEPPLQMDI